MIGDDDAKTKTFLLQKRTKTKKSRNDKIDDAFVGYMILVIDGFGFIQKNHSPYDWQKHNSSASIVIDALQQLHAPPFAGGILE